MADLVDRTAGSVEAKSGGRDRIGNCKVPKKKHKNYH